MTPAVHLKLFLGLIVAILAVWVFLTHPDELQEDKETRFKYLMWLIVVAICYYHEFFG